MEEVGARHILCRDVPPPYTLKEISIATKQCFADSFQEKLPIFFQSGVIVPLAHILAGRYTEATVAFLSIEETDRAPNVRRSRRERAPASATSGTTRPSAGRIKSCCSTAQTTP